MSTALPVTQKLSDEAAAPFNLAAIEEASQITSQYQAEGQMKASKQLKFKKSKSPSGHDLQGQPISPRNEGMAF